MTLGEALWWVAGAVVGTGLIMAAGWVGARRVIREFDAERDQGRPAADE